jgi:hypothetical protein
MILTSSALSIHPLTIRAERIWLASSRVCPGLCAMRRCFANASLTVGCTSERNGYWHNEQRFSVPSPTKTLP